MSEGVRLASSKPPERHCAYCGRTIGHPVSVDDVTAKLRAHMPYCRPDFRSEVEILRRSGKTQIRVRKITNVFVRFPTQSAKESA